MTEHVAHDPADAPAGSEHASPVAHGAELARLIETFGQARSGRGSFVLLEGVPGVGKSLLMAAARETAQKAGMEVLVAAGSEMEQDSTFGVALQLFESHIARADDEHRARVFSGAARLAAPLFADGPREVLPAGQAFSLLHGLYWLCGNIAVERPLVLTIDDAHWADPPTLRFLLYLAQRVDELPVTVLLAGTRPHSGPTRETLAEIAAHSATARLRLAPLGPRAVARQLRETLFPTAHEAFCLACFDVTRGNLYLLRELAIELFVQQVEPTERAAERVWKLGPETVADAVLMRIRRLGSRAEELTRAVTVLGEGAEPRHVADLAALDSSHATRLSDALREIDVLADDPRLSFAHPIVKTALEAKRPVAERADAHLRAAKILAREDVPAERVARHLLEARASRADWVIDVLQRAAGRALERGAPDSAAVYLKRALAEPPEAGRRARLAFELARVETTAGRAGAVERLCEAVEQLDDPRERALARLEAGRALHARGRTRDAVEMFERGTGELNGSDPRLVAQLRSACGTVAPTRAAPSATAVRASDSANELVLLARRAAQATLRGEPRDDVVDLARRALGRGDLLREETCDSPVYYQAAYALTVAEDLQTAEFALTAAVEDARAGGSVLGLATASYFRSLAIIRRGRVDDAASDAENALAAERYGWRLALPGARAILAERFIERGEVAGAAREAWLGTRTEDDGDEIASCLCLMSRAHVHRLRQRPRKALDDYLTCGRKMEEAGIRNPAVLPWRSGAALAAHALGDRSGARRLVEEELSLAREFGALGPIGCALQALGALQGGEEGLETLRMAVATLESSPAALRRAQAMIDYGGALRRTGKRRAARDPLLAGRDLAHRLGAEELAKRATEELLAAGARPRRTAVRGAAALTPRERQAADLAAQGLSNREIAERLFVTVKTVEWHLRHSYAKLDVRSRRDLCGVLTTSEMSAAVAEPSTG